jgi:hypothetical protein
MEPRCSECGERAVEIPPANWDPSWGPLPEWSHEDGEPLCPTEGLGGDERQASVIFV